MQWKKNGLCLSLVYFSGILYWAVTVQYVNLLLMYCVKARSAYHNVSLSFHNQSDFNFSLYHIFFWLSWFTQKIHDWIICLVSIYSANILKYILYAQIFSLAVKYSKKSLFYLALKVIILINSLWTLWRSFAKLLFITRIVKDKN